MRTGAGRVTRVVDILGGGATPGLAFGTGTTSRLDAVLGAGAGRGEGAGAARDVVSGGGTALGSAEYGFPITATENFGAPALPVLRVTLTEAPIRMRFQIALSGDT